MHELAQKEAAKQPPPDTPQGPTPPTRKSRRRRGEGPEGEPEVSNKILLDILVPTW
jgi:hypothetical protein